MAYVAISNTIPQYSKDGDELASGYYLKGYTSGTTTPLSMATDATGGTLLAKCKIGSLGFPLSNDSDETSIFVPYFNANYKLALYTNATDADANTTANAIWVVDAFQTASSSIVTYNQGGTSAVTRTIESRLRDYTSVFDYMTTAEIADVQAGTATLNVTTAIQAAIDAVTAANGGKLDFPEGTYSITSLTMKAGVFLTGAGPASQLKAAANADSHMLVATSINNFGVDNLKFDHNNANQTVTNVQPINITGCNRFWLEKLWINDAVNVGVLIGDVSETTGCTDGFLRDILITTCNNGHGISIDRSARIQGTNINIQDPDESGIQIFLSDYCTFNNITVEASSHPDEGFAALRVTANTSGTSSLHNTFNNIVSAGMSRGIMVAGTDGNTQYNTFSNFTIENSGRDSVYVDSNSRNIFSNGYILSPSQATTNTYSALRLNDADSNKFSHIQIRDITSSMQYSISITDTTTNSNNNTFSDIEFAAGQTGSINDNGRGNNFPNCRDEFYDSALASATTVATTQASVYHRITGTTTINDFAGGWNGQRITIKLGSALTITDGSGIETTSGANISGSAGDVYSFIYDGADDTWYQD